MGFKYSTLPDTLYRVRVPKIATYTEMEIELLGIPVSVDSDGKITSTEDDLVLVHLPLTKIIDIYSMGYPIYLVDNEALTEIYTILENYLKDTHSVTPELNVARHHEKRDLDIDRFAEEIFNLNKESVVNDMFNRKSGFDIGISKLEIPSASHRLSNNSRPSVLESYAEQNPVVGRNLDDVYLTRNTNTVNPEEVTRTPAVRKRKRFKPNNKENAC